MSTGAQATGWLGRNGRAVDVAVAVVLTTLAQGQVAADTAVWVRLCLLLTTGATALRRTSPLLCAALVCAGTALMGLAAEPPSVFGEYLAVLVVAYSVAEQLSIAGALAGAGLLVLGVVAHDWNSPEYGGVAGVTSDLAIPAVVWGLGRVVRLQRTRAEVSDELAAQLDRDRLELARRAVADERAHLARELHDVVTHSLSMVVIQAQGAQRVLDDQQPEVRASLATIEQAGRGALHDMRRLLGLLRPEESGPEIDPQPVLAELPALVERVRASGLPVTLTTRGPVERVAGGVGLSAYRVVQESLTNALKYAGQAATTVRVGCAGHELEVLVEDEGTGAAQRQGAGRGLVGMRERVALYGGTFEAGPGPTGGFRIRAVFPLEGP